VQLKSDKDLDDLSAMFNPILRGWKQDYGRYHGSALKTVWQSMNVFLIRWLMRKLKKLPSHRIRAAETLKRTSTRCLSATRRLSARQPRPARPSD
jgi:RNA-directed DNA polymerase